MVTSRGDRSNVIKAAEAGVSDYLTKPFSPDELLRKVIKQLTRIGKAPALRAKRQTAASGAPSSSLDILTGGRAEKHKKVTTKPPLPLTTGAASGMVLAGSLTRHPL